MNFPATEGAEMVATVKYPRSNCTYCNRSFKYHSSRQAHEQMDCRKAPRPATEGAEMTASPTEKKHRENLRQIRRLQTRLANHQDTNAATRNALMRRYETDRRLLRQMAEEEGRGELSVENRNLSQGW